MSNVRMKEMEALLLGLEKEEDGQRRHNMCLLLREVVLSWVIEVKKGELEAKAELYSKTMPASVKDCVEEVQELRGLLK